jgi:hypothetical protein
VAGACRDRIWCAGSRRRPPRDPSGTPVWSLQLGGGDQARVLAVVPGVPTAPVMTDGDPGIWEPQRPGEARVAMVVVADAPAHTCDRHLSMDRGARLLARGGGLLGGEQPKDLGVPDAVAWLASVAKPSVDVSMVVDDDEMAVTAQTLGRCLALLRVAAARALPAQGRLNVFVEIDALDRLYAESPPLAGPPPQRADDLPPTTTYVVTRPAGETPLVVTRLGPGPPVTRPAGAAAQQVDARLYTDGRRLTGGVGPRIATVVVPRGLGRWTVPEPIDSVEIGRHGRVQLVSSRWPGRHWDAADWDAAALSVWITRNILELEPGRRDFTLWLTLEDEVKTPLSALAAGLRDLQVAAARALPRDATMTIYLALAYLGDSVARLR